MDITYLGHSSFRIKGKNAVVVTDPYDASIVGLKFPKIDADIVTISHDHADHNQASLVAGIGEAKPRVVTDPGEYEIKGVSIFGIPSYHDAKLGEERGPNIIYVFTIDGLNICYLGDLGHKLSEELIGQIGTVDILIIPIGGFYTIDASTAAEIVAGLEPKIVIPMHYKAEGVAKELAEKLTGVEDFVKQLGVEPIRDSKFTITADKLPEEMQLVVLERKI